MPAGGFLVGFTACDPAWIGPEWFITSGRHKILRGICFQLRASTLRLPADSRFITLNWQFAGITPQSSKPHVCPQTERAKRGL